MQVKCKDREILSILCVYDLQSSVVKS